MFANLRGRGDKLRGEGLDGWKEVFGSRGFRGMSGYRDRCAPSLHPREQGH